MTYDPSIDINNSFPCFIYSLINLLPDKEYRDNSLEFFNLVDINVYILRGELFLWSYQFHDYINKKRREKGESVPEFSYSQARKKYNIELIDKVLWGSSVWYVIHYLTFNLPSVLDEKQKAQIKCIMVCLMYILPCPICRKHLREHLIQFPIHDYLSTRDAIFSWGVQLHNRVSSSLNKPIMSVRDAALLYM